MVGTPATVDAPAPRGPFAAVFEDDGDTGYFYGLDMRLGEQPILDALHIYNAAAVSDRKKPSLLQIVWSADNNIAGLFINHYPHAVFDFAACRACCRTGFPAPAGYTDSHEWDEELVRPLL